jgi:hypothetical protein
MDAKKSRPTSPASEPPRRSRLRFFVPLLIALASAALLVAGLVFLGQVARERLGDSDRFAISFGEMECFPPPPAQDRATFLNEVQYLAAMPSRLRLLEDDLVKRLAEAFVRHPWVERVERISRGPQQVRVYLVYRTPVLAVPVGGQVRVVDGHGILLPTNAEPGGLPVYEGKARPPAGAAGTLWGDAGVESAARKLARN